MQMRELTLGVLLLCPIAQADEAMTLNFKQLTMETALQIAQATVLDCREKGYQVAATVVNRSGTAGSHPRFADTACDHPHQRRKSTGCGEFHHCYLPAARRYGKQPHCRTPGGDIDEACAQAGIDTVIDDLEME